MLFGVILHSLFEEKSTFPIYYSHFFSHIGNDKWRIHREQAIASLVSKEYGFRALCRVYSQVSKKLKKKTLKNI